jgi:hypothetical protein
MGEMNTKYLALILICGMLTSLAAFQRVNAQVTAIYADPALVQDITIGDTFTVNFSVSDVVNLFTWQVLLLFNASVLACTNVQYAATGGIFAGHGTIPVTPTIDNETGLIIHGASLVGADVVSGSGILVQATFKVLAIGKSGLNFSRPYGADTFLLNGDLDEIPVTITDGFFTNVPIPTRDVAVTNLAVSKNFPRQGENLTIDATVLNNGTEPESFNVNIYVDDVLINTQGVVLASGESTVVTFTWNTSSATLAAHTIKAEAEAVPDETKLDNNAMTKTITVLSSEGLLTDLNGDGKVDMMDIAQAAFAFGSSPGHPRWNPAADINGDGKVDLRDIILVAKDFGKQLT